MKKKIRILGITIILWGIIFSGYYLLKPKIDEEKYLEVIAKKMDNNDYFAILEITKIDLKRELFPINDKNNNVDKNILVHEESTFLGSDESNIILAGHSGVGANAYFKDLYLLEENDEVILYYQGVKWIYEIVDIEYQEKTGVLYIKEDYQDMLTLITCTKNNSNTQTIYYGVLNRTENI